MSKYTQITKENLKEFVNKFYTTILKDDVVGPFFIERLGDDMSNEKWTLHLNTLNEFWSTMILRDGNYYGAPFPPHVTMDLKRETFYSWLTIFNDVLDEMYEPTATMQMKDAGSTIANNFINRLGL